MNGKTKMSADNHLLVTDNRTTRQYKIPIVNNAVRAVDFNQISTDQQHPGLRIFAPGLVNTAVTESAVTLIDGKQGILQYRNHPIEELFHNNNYEEVIYLLIWGHLPNSQQATTFRQSLAAATYIPNLVVNVIKAFPPTSPTSTMLQAGLSAWSASNPIQLPTQTKGNSLDEPIIKAIPAYIVTVALVYCHQRGRAVSRPNPKNSLIENFLLMVGHVDPETGKPKPEHVKLLNRHWILYADHEMSNATAAFLLTGSTLADPLSCAIASVSAVYGPLHGAAIDMAYHSLEKIRKPENVPQAISDVKSGKGVLYGFGHRIYKTMDPRAVLVRELMDEVGRENPLLAIAMEIDRVASADEYFISRKLSPNVELYGCLVCSALGFPIDIILAILGGARLPGILAHWREVMTQSPRLWRPSSIWVGAKL